MADVKKRQYFLDALRTAAVCAVVLLHTVTAVADNTDMTLYPVQLKVFLIIKDLVCWCVPVFIMISGYLFLDPRREFTFKAMVNKYCRRILLALFLFGVPYAWAELVVERGGFGPDVLWQGVVRVLQGKSWAHMWYLYMILFLYIITPAVKRILKKSPVGAPAAAAAFLFAVCSVVPFLADTGILPQKLVFTPRDFIYLFYYICGYLFVSRGSWKRWHCRAFALSAVVAAVVMTAGRLAGYDAAITYDYPFAVFLAISLFGAVLAGEKSTEKKDGGFSEKTAALLDAATPLCFGVYLIHPVFINYFYKYRKITPLSFYMGASLPFFFLLILLLSVLGSWIMRKIPLLRRYVL